MPGVYTELPPGEILTPQLLANIQAASQTASIHQQISGYKPAQLQMYKPAQDWVGPGGTQQGVGIGGLAAPVGLVPATVAAVVPGAAATVATVATGVAGAGGLLGGLGALFDLFGMAWPWETPEGEGFIAPWTGDITLPSGKIGQTGQTYPGEYANMFGSPVVSGWNTNPAAPKYGQNFYRLMNGRIGTVTKFGVVKTWKPKKHLVIPTNINQMPIGKLVRAERMIDRMMGKVARKSRSLKRQK